MVPADSARIPRVPAYSGAASVSTRVSPTGLSPAAAPLSSGFGYACRVHSLAVLQPRSVPRHRRFGLLRVRSPLLAQSLGYFLFLRVLRCFSSPGSLHPSRVVTRSPAPGCPIRTSADHRIFAPTRGFSQLVTSFVASESPGILHVPFSPFFMTLVFNRFEHHAARSLKLFSLLSDFRNAKFVTSCFA